VIDKLPALAVKVTVVSAAFAGTAVMAATAARPVKSIPIRRYRMSSSI
jgi:hypothetical protein